MEEEVIRDVLFSLVLDLRVDAPVVGQARAHVAGFKCCLVLVLKAFKPSWRLV